MRAAHLAHRRSPHPGCGMRRSADGSGRRFDRAPVRQEGQEPSGWQGGLRQAGPLGTDAQIATTDPAMSHQGLNYPAQRWLRHR